jgi:hypothetical protein
MPERVTQQRRVEDEHRKVVNSCERGRMIVIRKGYDLTVPSEEAPANYVPAAAVIRRGLALSGFTGCKGRAGGLASQW